MAILEAVAKPGYFSAVSGSMRADIILTKDDGGIRTILIDYGTDPTLTTYSSTASQVWGASQTGVVTFTLTGLSQFTRYYYRYRVTATNTTPDSPQIRSFQCDYPTGSHVRSLIVSDRHLWQRQYFAHQNALMVDALTIQNASLIRGTDGFPPWALLDLGDSMYTKGTGASDVQFGAGTNYVTTAGQADDVCVYARLQTPILHSSTFCNTFGNHEANQEFHLLGVTAQSDAGTANDSGVLTRNSIAKYLGLPDGTGLWSGHAGGYYYAREIGDAVFCHLDAGWATAYGDTLPNPLPQSSSPFAIPGGGVGRDQLELGQDQYDTMLGAGSLLATSSRQWKSVFIHNLTGGCLSTSLPYGRGLKRYIRSKVAGKSTFAWGGEGWTPPTRVIAITHGAIHARLKALGVQAVFIGHDHFCYTCMIDGIQYTTVPRTAGEEPDGGAQKGCFDWGYAAAGDYGTLSGGTFTPFDTDANAKHFPNAGFIVLDHTATYLQATYVRTWLAGTGSPPPQDGITTNRYPHVLFRLTKANTAGSGVYESGTRTEEDPDYTALTVSDSGHAWQGATEESGANLKVINASSDIFISTATTSGATARAQSAYVKLPTRNCIIKCDIRRQGSSTTGMRIVFWNDQTTPGASASNGWRLQITNAICRIQLDGADPGGTGFSNASFTSTTNWQTVEIRLQVGKKIQVYFDNVAALDYDVVAADVAAEGVRDLTWCGMEGVANDVSAQQKHFRRFSASPFSHDPAAAGAHAWVLPTLSV